MIDITFEVIRTAYYDFLLSLIVAMIIFFIGAIIARIVDQGLEKFLKVIEINTLLEKLIRVKTDFQNSLRRFIKFIIYFVTTLLSLESLGIVEESAVALGVLLLVIIIGLIIVELVDFIPNVNAYLIVRSKKRIAVGKSFTYKTVTGQVLSKTLSSVKLLTDEGDIIALPNRSLVKK